MTLLDTPTILDRELQEILDVTRREFLGGTVTAGALAVLAASGLGSVADAATRWSFTDDLGRTVHLNKTPRRFVVLDDVLTGQLWSQGLHSIVGAPLNLDGNNFHLLDACGVTAADRGRMVKVGGASSSDIDVEAVAKAAPDLIITNTDTVKDSMTTRFPQLVDVAPWIGINAQTVSFEKGMASCARLLHALGVRETDLSAKARYDAQAARLRAALKAKPGLRVGFFLSADKSGAYLMGAKDWPCTLTLGALGADLAKITGTNPYFETVSWENVVDLPLDLVVYTDGSGGTPNPSQLPWSEPTWRAMPAVRAGQYVNSGEDWYVYNYATYTGLLTKLTKAVTVAKVGIGPK